MSETSILSKLHVPDDWGIEQRGRNRDDFKGAIWPAVTAIALIIASTFFFLDGGLRLGLNKDDAGLLTGLTILSTIITTVFALCRFDEAWKKAGNEAVEAAEEKFEDWKHHVLIAFLEKKHGVAVRSWSFELDSVTVTHPERGNIKVRVQGINWNDYFIPRLYCSDDIGYSVPPIPRFYEEPWMEEIISPAKVSYRRREAVGQ